MYVSVSRVVGQGGKPLSQKANERERERGWSGRARVRMEWESEIFFSRIGPHTRSSL